MSRRATRRIASAPPRRKSPYLRGDKVLEIAKLTGARRFIPGYGFLSENESFARQCRRGHRVHRTAARRDRGDGAQGRIETADGEGPACRWCQAITAAIQNGMLASEAKRIGFPVLIKSQRWRRQQGHEGRREKGRLCGGAGVGQARGEELVRRRQRADRALPAAGPRHIEIQVFADEPGHCVYLFERDCSLQRATRRSSKKRPRGGMTEARRRQMGEAACAAAHAVGYVGAGTVEFIAEHDFATSGRFYFME